MMSNTSSSTATTIAKTTEQEYEAIARRFHMEIFQQGKLDVADEILTHDFVLRNPTLPSELTHGPEGVKKFASGVADSSSGFQIVHHDTISKGDKVLIRWTYTGVIKKEMLGIRPSDKPVTITGFDLFRITTEGKIAELWQQFNVGSWP
jgi:predicted SnoaL-like aldol condensation-catalyzing enzyme